MYVTYLKALAALLEALNGSMKTIDEMEGQEFLKPYVQFAPVFLEGDLCGFISGEHGGEYSYFEVTKEQSEWWESGPWATRTKLA